MIIEEFDEEQNVSRVLVGFPERIMVGFPDMTLGSYFVSASACNAVAANVTDTSLNCAAAAEFPLPEPLIGNAATCTAPGEGVTLISLLICEYKRDFL